MNKTTDLKAIIEVSKSLYDAVPIEEVGGSLAGLGVVQHPFASSTVLCKPDSGELIDLTTQEGAKWHKEILFKHIDSPSTLFAMLGSAWYMTWFKYACEFMSDKDYGNYLSQAWFTQDNPNQDVNVSRQEAVELFRKAKARYLMNKDELAYFKALPDKVTIWRGVSPGRERLGLSWTDDKEKAVWFKERFERGDKEGYVLEATVPKRSILAYFNRRDEDELVVDVFSVIDKIKEV